MVLIEHGMHPYSAEKINLPSLFGAMNGVLLAAKVDPKGACHGCAYRLGTAANQSPCTSLDAEYTLQNLDPFMCHADLDDKGEPTRPCVGHRKALRA